MEWSDEAVVIGVRPFGEHSAILEALTRSHGRHLGLLRSANSKQMRGMLEAGNHLMVHWRARLDNQLGNFSIELSSARAAHFFEDGLKLAALSSVELLEMGQKASDYYREHLGLAVGVAKFGQIFEAAGIKAD